MKHRELYHTRTPSASIILNPGQKTVYISIVKPSNPFRTFFRIF